MYATTDSPTYGYQTILEVQGTEAKPVGMFRNVLADRVVELLNRHGLEDCTTEDLEAALNDIKQRGHPHSHPPIPTTGQGTNTEG